MTPLQSSNLETALVVGLLVVLVVVRWSGIIARSGPWKHRVDWPATLLAAVLGAAWVTRVEGPFWFATFPLTASDFGQYCTALADMPIAKGVNTVASGQRSIVAGAIPRLLADHMGPLSALGGGALLATTVYCGAAFAMARLLHSRLAGACAVAAIGLFAPLVALPRMMTFYPEVAAIAALAAAGAIAALVCRTPQSAAFAGLGAGLLALADVRGWLLLVPGLLVALVGALARGSWPRWARVLLLCLPLVLAWTVAARPGVMPWSTLSEQVTAHVQDAGERRGLHLPFVHPTKAQSFNFGQGVPEQILPTLRLLQEKRTVAQAFAPTSETQVATACLTGLAGLLLPVGLLAAFALRRAPIRIGALLILSVPGAFAAWEAASLIPHPRQFLIPMLMGPVLVGVAVGALFGNTGAPGTSPARTGARVLLSGFAHLVIALGLAAVVRYGQAGKPVTTQLRWPALVDSEPARTWAALDGGRIDGESMSCFNLLQAERSRGGEPWPIWIERPRPRTK